MFTMLLSCRAASGIESKRQPRLDLPIVQLLLSIWAKLSSEGPSHALLNENIKLHVTVLEQQARQVWKEVG